jgi:hypothetical protein
MPSEARRSYYLSYEVALELWARRQEQIDTQAKQALKTEPQTKRVADCRRLLAVARAKDWASKAFGKNHNRFSDQEDLESPLPDHTQIRPGANIEDIILHCHKAVQSIGLEDLLLSNPDILLVVDREFFLLSLRFRSSSLPSKNEFTNYVRAYLSHIKEASRIVDNFVRLFGSADSKQK